MLIKLDAFLPFEQYPFRAYRQGRCRIRTRQTLVPAPPRRPCLPSRRRHHPND